MSSENQPEPLPHNNPHVAVFGLDENRKAHASVFTQTDAELARKAAGLMRMHALQLEGPEHQLVAQALPFGRVFASGKAFVPYVKKALYDRLCALSGIDPDAVVEQAALSAAGRVAAEKSRSLIDNHPEHWDQIRRGSLVLAVDQPEDGWFEAVVIDMRPDGHHVVAWRDFDDIPPFHRQAHELALLPPGAQSSLEVEQ